MKTNIVAIKEASIKPRMTMKIVEMITPADHTDFFPLKDPYAKNAKTDAKTNQVMVDNRVPKYKIGYNTDNLVSSQIGMGSPPPGICTTNPIEKRPHAINIPPSISHRPISKYTIVGLFARFFPPSCSNSIVLQNLYFSHFKSSFYINYNT